MATVFSITYKKNDGSSTELVCESGSKHVIDEITSVGQNWGEQPQNWSRDGYTFQHWNTAADDSGTSYNGGDLYTVKSITLYAIWQADTPVGADVSVMLGNTEIASLSDTGSVTLATAGTYVDEDITIDYTKSGGGGSPQTANVSVTSDMSVVKYVDANGTFHNMPSGNMSDTCLVGSIVVVLESAGDNVSVTGLTLINTEDLGARGYYRYCRIYQVN
jgi:uncharacterized repeat protein (TIGR02543 family)